MSTLNPYLQKGLGKLGRCERGTIFMEALVAIMVLTTLGTALLSGLSTSMGSGQKTDVQSNFENIARNQMEDTFDQPYQPPPYTYPSISTPQGYTVTSVAEEYVAGDSNIEKIVVTVTHTGSPDYLLEALRTR